MANNEKETIEVKKDKLSALLDANKTLLERVDRLESAASKAGLAKYDSQHAKRRRKRVKLLMYDGKVVERWSDMLKNTVEKNVKTKSWEEEQIIQVYFFGEKEPMEFHYETFNRNYTKMNAIVLSETITNETNEQKYGSRILKVKADDGKEYKLGNKFVN